MSIEDPLFYVQDYRFRRIARSFTAQAVVINSRETVDSYGTLSGITTDHTDTDPADALHGALTKAERAIGVEPPVLVETIVFPMPDEHRALVKMVHGKDMQIHVGSHPFDGRFARAEAVFNGHKKHAILLGEK
jgi:hypothetical protein